jgi:hypothetical protein
MICVVSTEVVARAHAQAQVEAVILHTLSSTLTSYSQNFIRWSLLTHAITNIKMGWLHANRKIKTAWPMVWNTSENPFIAFITAFSSCSFMDVGQSVSLVGSDSCNLTTF